MREISRIGGMQIVFNVNPCAHQCRYCLFGELKKSNLPFYRAFSIIERFFTWKRNRSSKNFNIALGSRYCDDCDLATYRRMINLQGYSYNGLLFLGGIQMRSETEMRVWLRERHALGARTIVASLAGYGKVHDYWNGRDGDFDFVMSTMRIASELGMALHQQIFLMKSTVPLLEELINKLDLLPGKVKHREIYPLFYLGHARLQDHERVTKTDIEKLPERITKFFYKQENWRSERDWIDIFQQEKEGDTLGKVTLRLDLDEDNIDQIESLSCNEIIADLKDRTRAAYAALPTRKELCEEFGNSANCRLYMFRQDVERKWLDSYLEAHPISFERHLTHLAKERM